MLTSLDHVVLLVRDLPAATATYSRLLGRAPSWRGSHPGQGTANALFRLDRTYVELLAVEGDGTLSAMLHERLEERGEGPLALVYGTDDVAAFARGARDRGLAAGEPVAMSGRDRVSGAERRWKLSWIDPSSTRGVPMLAIEHLSPLDALPPAEASGPAPVVGIDHVVVRTGDAEAAIRIYRDGLGLRLALDRTSEQWGMRLLFFRVGGITVELAQALSGADRGADDFFWGVSWKVADVDGARSRLAAAGFDVSGVRTGRREGTRVFTGRSDTHGVATLLIG